MEQGESEELDMNDHVQHQSGWTGVVIDVDPEKWGRIIKVRADDGHREPAWWLARAFSRADK